MSEPEPVYKVDKPQSDQTAHLLEVRQYAIGLVIATERLLESAGHPVESAVRTRHERRILTRNDKKR